MKDAVIRQIFGEGYQHMASLEEMEHKNDPEKDYYTWTAAVDSLTGWCERYKNTPYYALASGIAGGIYKMAEIKWKQSAPQQPSSEPDA